MINRSSKDPSSFQYSLDRANKTGTSHFRLEVYIDYSATDEPKGA